MERWCTDGQELLIPDRAEPAADGQQQPVRVDQLVDEHAHTHYSEDAEKLGMSKEDDFLLS